MLPRQVKVKYLSQRVHAGICPTAAMDPDQSSRDFAEARLNRILDTPSSDLALPTRKGRTIIGADDLPARRS